MDNGEKQKMKSCTEGLSDEKYTELHNRIPSGIELELAINYDEDHPQHKINEEKGYCNSDISTNENSHLECKRKKGHRGKHYCFECGFSWSDKK